MKNRFRIAPTFKFIAVIAIAIFSVAMLSGCGDDKKAANPEPQPITEADAKVNTTSGNDEEQIRNVVRAFGGSALAADAKKICTDYLSDHAEKALVQEGDCVATIKKLSAFVKSIKMAVKSVKVKGDKATAQVEVKVVNAAAATGQSKDEVFAQTQTMQLVKEDGKWKLDFDLGTGAAAGGAATTQ